MENRSILTGSTVVLALFLLSTTVQAAQSTYSYKDADNNDVYGVIEGKTKMPLNTTAKKAQKVAKKADREQ